MSMLLSDDYGEITSLPEGKDPYRYCVELMESIPPGETPYNKRSTLQYIKGDLCVRNVEDPDRFEKAAIHFRGLGLPSALHHLGYMCENGKINPPEGKDKFQAAAEHYQESNKPESLCNLGRLYNEGKVSPPAGKNKIQAAADCYQESKHFNAYYNLLVLYKYNHEELGITYDQSLSNMRDTSFILLERLKREKTQERLFFFGFHDLLSENYESALYWFSEAVKLGHELAQKNLGIVQNILSARNRVEVLQSIQESTPKVEASPISDYVAVAEEVCLESKDVVTDKKTTYISTTSSDGESKGSEPAVTPQYFLIDQSLEAEIAEAQAELMRLIEEKTKQARAVSSASTERPAVVNPNLNNPAKSPRLNFLSRSVYNDYVAALEIPDFLARMQELLDSLTPWKGISTGNWETLGNKYQGYRCDSIRINSADDRFVYHYKNGNFYVLAAKDHYKTQNLRSTALSDFFAVEA